MLGFLRNIRRWWINRRKGWFQVKSLPKVVSWIQKARSSTWPGKQWNFFDSRLRHEENLRLRAWKRFAEQLASSSGIDTQSDFRGACQTLRLQGRLARIPADVNWLERFVRRDPFWDANRQLLKAGNGMTPDEAWQNFQIAYARNPIAALTLFTSISPGPEPVWASYAEGANTTLALEHGNDPQILHDLLALDWPVRGSMLHLMYS
jgi:hypothetical protein